MSVSSRGVLTHRCQLVKIPGIPEYLINLVGKDGYTHFQTSIAENLPKLATAAKRLFRNWITIVYDK